MVRRLYGIDFNRYIDDKIKYLELVKKQFNQVMDYLEDGGSPHKIPNGDYKELQNERWKIEEAMRRGSLDEYLK